MEKKKGFQMPHTYIIIFGVILFAALLTVFIPLGKYDTKEITYMQNGVEKTRTVLDPESFQYILDERLAVGAKLPNEYELADRFGVSRGTIREAVKLLVSRGVLRVKHGSGTYVASLMPLKADPLGLDAIEDRIQLALDLTDVRLMLEPAIAELAARNRTEEEAQRLTEYCDAVRRRIQAGEDYLIEDMRFHWYLAKCSHNMVVEPLMPIIDAAVVSIANITRKELLTATVDTHQEILSGVLDQDPQAARAAMALHLEMNRIVIKHAKERSEKTK